MTDGSPQYVSLDDVQKLVDAQLAKVRQEHEDALASQKAESDARIDALQGALEAAQKAGQPSTNVVQHGGGPGTEIAETWGQADQARAIAEADAKAGRAA